MVQMGYGAPWKEESYKSGSGSFLSLCVHQRQSLCQGKRLVQSGREGLLADTPMLNIELEQNKTPNENRLVEPSRVILAAARKNRLS